MIYITTAHLTGKVEKTTTFLWAGRFISNEHWQHKKRTSNFHEIIIVLSGTLFIQIGDKKYEAKKNSLLLIPQGVQHFGTQECPENTSFYWFHFLFPEQWSIVSKEVAKEQIISTYPYSHEVFIPLFSDELDFTRLNILGNQLLDILNRNESNRFYLDLLMTNLLIEVTEELLSNYKGNQNPHKESKTLSFITEWIKASLDQELTLEIIAKKFNYNPAYLSRLFSKEINVTLMNYIKNARIERAKSLLGNLSISVEEVANLCGFHDEKYFMRCFKKHELMTASQYREAFNKSRINNK